MPSSARPQRRPFAAGDWLATYPEGGAHRYRIDTSVEKPGWKARSRSSFGKPPYPGTALRFRDAFYEIVVVRWKRGTFPRTYYYLAPWDDRFPVRNPVEYSEAVAHQQAADHKARIQANRHAGLLSLLQPLVGMLPGVDQRRIENVYGILALQQTFISALFEMFLGAPYMVMTLVTSFTGESYLPAQASVGLLGGPLFAQGFFKLASAWEMNEPMGSLLVVLPLESYRAVRRSFDPEFRRQLAERRKLGRDGVDLLRDARDEVLEVFGEDYQLEVVSLLPKPHWTPRTAVQYQDTWYIPVESRTESAGKGVKYRFRLQTAPEEMLFSSTLVYEPTEVRELFRQKRRQDLGSWVAAFGPIWGLLPEDDQSRLRDIYDHPALKYTRWTVIALTTGAVLNVWATLANARLGLGEIGPAFLVWLVLVGEGVLRTLRLRELRATGSLLGFVVRPFAARFLE